MKTRPRPNLFIIGAMKSGTTSLNAYLGAHPQILMSETKEPGYFVKEMGWAKGEEWYLSLFESAGEIEIVGEASTHYTKAPRYEGVAERISRFNPDARFIYIMRDPVKRTISHYWHNVRFEGERRDMLTAIREEGHYREVSHYSVQMAPYFETFGRDRVYILTFEEMVADPLVTVRKIFAWLGIDPSFEPPNIKQPKYVTPRQVAQARGLGILNRFRCSAVWNTVHDVFPKSWRMVGRRLALKETDRSSAPIEEAVSFLRPIQLEQTQDLCEMLGRPFPEWTMLYQRNQHENV